MYMLKQNNYLDLKKSRQAQPKTKIKQKRMASIGKPNLRVDIADLVVDGGPNHGSGTAPAVTPTRPFTPGNFKTREPFK